ncbi:MAG: hypothetical protein KDD24_02675 [Flavobacteriales bacterium]|nr:hypothetical protein [Flavobacteriales bacterium]MCB9173117.1 hypothetical protein [Flavobacteriales bacterium]
MKKKAVIVLLLLVVLGMFYLCLYTNVLIDVLYKEKIWVHRTNSVEKLHAVKDKFYGVELDIEFLDSLNVFDVNHPPAKSIGLTLDTYFFEASMNKTLHYWLDFKNLNEMNVEKSSALLERICVKNHINPSHVIVESNNVRLLEEFQHKGYQVSYYLNWPGLYTLDSIGLKNELELIKHNLKNINFPCNLSVDYHDYDILKHNFPNYNLLLWLDDNFDESIRNRFLLFQMLNNNNVKVILFKFKSHER